MLKKITARGSRVSDLRPRMNNLQSNVEKRKLKSQFALQSLNRIDELQFKYNQWNVYKV